MGPFHTPNPGAHPWLYCSVAVKPWPATSLLGPHFPLRGHELAGAFGWSGERGEVVVRQPPGKAVTETRRTDAPCRIWSKLPPSQAQSRAEPHQGQWQRQGQPSGAKPGRGRALGEPSLHLNNPGCTPGSVQLDLLGEGASGGPGGKKQVGQGHTANAGFSQLTQTPFTSWAFPIGPNVPQPTCVPLCPQPKCRALGALGAAPLAGPSPDPQELREARTRTWEAGQKVPKIQDPGSQCSLGLSLTQKSKLYLIFRNRPPTIAARWMTCVGWTC